MAKKETENANVVALLFEDQVGAENMLDNVKAWQDQGLLQVLDAVIAVRGVGDDVEIKQTHKFAGKYAGWGTGIGLAAGLLLGGPIGGMVVGAAIGGITGALKDYGVDDKFINQVSEGMAPNTSALFLMTTGGAANQEQILAELRPFKARIFSATLDPEMQSKLQDALRREE